MRALCFECRVLSDCHFHHIIPKSLGGKAVVPLCVGCHSVVHCKRMAASALTRIGMLKAKERGVHVGRPNSVVGLELDFVKKVFKKNPHIGVRELGAHLGVNPGIAWRLKKKYL